LQLNDDAALLRPNQGEELVLTKDMLVAGVHFFADDPPGAIAQKALRVNLSDLAAKGAAPKGFLLGLGLPADWSEDWLNAFVKGLAADAELFGIDLLGGDTVHVPGPLTLSITAIGAVPEGRMVQRGGAKAGDHIFVSGTIGDAALGLKVRRKSEDDMDWIAALSEAARAHLLDRYLLPQPRLALREALRTYAHAAMDVSDGLAGDLSKLLRLAGLTAEIAVTDIPLSDAAAGLAERLIEPIFCGGDDYEILCTVPPQAVPGFIAAAQAANIRVTHIGICQSGDFSLTFKDAKGRALPFERGSFQHF
jgi:thiamine-monophosphate kinase